jgi:DNA-binding transcriptional LysR family regulator/ABC-type Fe3+ transport system substrate-binding protein
MLDLNDLRLFALIAENGGIVRASRALNLPKSTVSRRLAALEAQLEVTLVDRNCETFTLTERGQEILLHCRGVAAAGCAAETFLINGRGRPTGTVRLSLSSAFRAVFSKLSVDVTERYPGIALMLEIADRDDDQTGDGFDLLLRTYRGQLQDSLLKHQRLGVSALRAVAHPRYVRRKGLPFCPDALIHFDLVAFDTTRDWRSLTFLSSEGDRQLVGHAPKLRSGDLGLVMEAIAAAAGIGIVPDFLCRAAIDAGQLIDVLPGWRADPLNVSLLAQPIGFPAPAVSAVAEMIQEAVRSQLECGEPHVQDGVARVSKTGQPLPNLHPTGTRSSSYNAFNVRSYARLRPEAAEPAVDPEGDVLMNPILKVAGAAMFGAASLLSMPAHADDTPGPIVLYTNDFESVLKDRFKADTGRDVDVVQMSGGELLARIAAESSNPQWDAVIFNGSNALYTLDQQEQLKRMVEPRNVANLNEVGKAQMPENKSWFPIGMAASCVLAYRTDLVKTPPAGFEDLSDPTFSGKVGMADPAVAAPAYPCVAQLFFAMGEERARTMFSGYFENGMRVFRTNGPVGKALTSGDISVALLTSQVAYSLKAGGAPIEIVWPKDGAPGSIRGVAVQAKTKRPESAQAFVEWLLEPATQNYLQDEAGPDGLFEPTVAGAGRRSDGPPEGSVYKVAPPDFAAAHEEAIKTWFADQAVR